MIKSLLYFIFTFSVCFGLNFSIYAQKVHNLDYKQVPESFKSHPEYGLLKLDENPNASELIHLRTKNSRVFSDFSTGTYYSVGTAGTFHFKDDKNRWLSIQDKISKSTNNEYGIFQTELPIKIDYRSGKTEMVLEKKGNRITFGENSSLQFIDKSGLALKDFSSNKMMSEPIVSGNQVILKDFLPGLNRVQEIEYWSVRTDYFIEQKLNMPTETEFLQISDQLNLPSNWKIEYGTGEMTINGWNGDLLIVNSTGSVVSSISRPLYYDSYQSEEKTQVSSHLGLGTYKISKNHAGYLIQLLVPASWLNQDNLVYPLVIDPTTTNTYASNFGLYELSGFNALCQADMDLNFPATGGFIVTGTNTSYRIWAKGYIFSSGSTDSYADKAEQRSRVGSLNGWSAVQNGSGTNHSSTNPSYFTAANNGQDYNMNNLTIANGCYENQPIIPFHWQGYQTFFPQSGPPAAQQTGCTMAYQELVANTWIVTATYELATVATSPTTLTYPATTFCSDITTVAATQTGTTGGVFTVTPAGLTVNATTGELNPSTSAVGTYTVTYSVGTAPCTSQSSAILSIVNAVTPTFTQVPAICSGGTFTLPTTSTNTPAITGTWTPAINNTTTTTYTFTPDPGQCANPVTMTVDVNPAPSPTASSNSPICEGATLNFTSSATGTFSWTGPNGFTSTDQNPSIPNATSAATGTYTLTTSGPCASSPITVEVVVNAVPTVTIDHTDILCNGSATGSATANATPAGTYTYSWSPSGGTAATASNLSAGNYTVTVANGSCTTTQSVVIAEPSAFSLATSSTESVCGTATGSVSVTTTGGVAPYSYSWSPSGATTASVSSLLAGVYTVTVTDANNCVKTASATVSSLNGPTLTVANKNNISCFGSADGSATLSVSGGTAPYTYVWTPTGGTSASAVDLGQGDYTVVVTDASGCTAEVEFNISEPTAMDIITSGTDSECGMSNGTVGAIATGGTGTYTYVWTPGNLSGANQTNLPSGTYSVTATDANGCFVSGSYTIVTTGSINVDVTPITATIDQGESVNLFATTTSPAPGITYSWSPPTGLSCTDCPNPIASPTETTTYVATISTPDGCVGKDSSLVFVNIICGEHFIPTIFSPNGDGNNDEFRIFGNCIVGMDLKIYNRWGEVVYESTNHQDSWDGTYKGEMMNSATFIYMVNLSFLDGRFIKEKGSVNLVR